MIRRLQNNEDDRALLSSYLHDVDNEFDVPISTKQPIEHFVAKILQSGIVFAIQSGGGKCLSINCFYCNNQQTKIAYITLVSTRREARKHGYARGLLREVISYCKEMHFRSIQLHSLNPQAISLYIQEGFKEIGTDRTQCRPRQLLSYDIV